jgi:hypothetical protein
MKLLRQLLEDRNFVRTLYNKRNIQKAHAALKKAKIQYITAGPDSGWFEFDNSQHLSQGESVIGSVIDPALEGGNWKDGKQVKYGLNTPQNDDAADRELGDSPNDSYYDQVRLKNKYLISNLYDGDPKVSAKLKSSLKNKKKLGSPDDSVMLIMQDHDECVVGRAKDIVDYLIETFKYDADYMEVSEEEKYKEWVNALREYDWTTAANIRYASNFRNCTAFVAAPGRIASDNSRNGYWI